MIELKLLGSLEIDGVRGEGAIALLSQPKRVALLTYLMLAEPRGFQRRDSLVALFWPEADEPHARRALNQALYHLRQCIGRDALVSRGADEVGLNFDAVRSDAAVLLGHPPAMLPPSALSLYRGELLAGFHADAAPEFEQWLIGRRDAAREAALRLAVRLAAESEASGDLQGDLAYLQKAAEIAPLDEAVFVKLLLACDRTGNRARAAELYERFVDRLERDLGVHPSPETAAVFERVRSRPDVHDRTIPAATGRTPLAKVRPHSAAGAVHARPRGLRRRWSFLLFVTVAVAGGLLAALGTRPERSGARIVVAPFLNRTGEPPLEFVGPMAADWITEALTSRSVQPVVDPLTGLAAAAAVLPGAGESMAERARLLSAESRAQLVVDGSYDLAGDTLWFHVRISNDKGDVLRSLEPVAVHRSAPHRAVEVLHRRVAGQLAGLLDVNLTAFDGDIHPPSYEAYQDYLEGMRAYLRHDGSTRAAASFEAAYRADTTFARALLRLMLNQRWRGGARRLEVFDSLAQSLEHVRDRLSLADRHHFDAIVATRHLDFQAAYRAAQLRAQAAPGSDDASRELALAAQRTNRPYQAIALLRRLDPQQGLLRDWPAYWNSLTDNLHQVGDHHSELDALRAAVASGDDEWLVHQVRALAALGRVDSVARLVSLLAQRPTAESAGGPFIVYGSIPHRPGALLLAAQELQAHGHRQAADSFLREALAWYAAQSPDASRARGFRTGWARALMMQERWRDAERVLSSAPEVPEWTASEVVTLAEFYRAIALARQGHPELARVILARVGSERRRISTPYVMAVLYAAIGDEDAAHAHLGDLLRHGYLTWRPLHEDPVLLPLIQTPRFRALLRPRG